MNADLLLRRQRGSLVGWNGAAVVIAIGEQDQHFVGLLAGLQHLDAQTNGVADCRVGPGHADADIVQQDLQAGVVEGQGRLRIGRATKHDQAHAVFAALVDKPLYHLFDRGQAVDQLTFAVAVITRFHRLGNVDGQQQVAHWAGLLQRRLDPDRACQRADQ